MILALFFGVVALLYASIGFGGGSSYTALLVWWGVPMGFIPALSLICNMVVVSGNCLHYAKAKALQSSLLFPLVFISVPFAYLGGTIPLPKNLFISLLSFSLLLSGISMLFQHKTLADLHEVRPISLTTNAFLGGILGLLSGLTGIGGGIFLAPILYHLRAGSPKHIASTASVFILVNSFAGFIGQMQKLGTTSELLAFWILPVFAFIGGQIGQLISRQFFPKRILVILTALLICWIGGKLAFGLIY